MRSKVLSLLLLMVLLANAACAPQVVPTVADTAPAANAPATQPPAPTTAAPAQDPAAPAAGEKTLTVLAAASLTESFNEIGAMFEAQNPGVKAAFSFAGSQQLAQQLDQGAPADVFASASKKYMEAALKSGRVADGAAKTFANNRLVVIYPTDNPAGLKELKDLAKPGLKIDFAAKEVPVGQYSLDFLDKAIQDPAFGAAFKDDVLKNVVSYEENVKAVLTKVSLGEADAGIVYLSDISQEAASKVGKLDIPDALNVIATYPIAAIKDSQDPDLAQAFVDLVLSPDGQKVLEKYNFIPATQARSSQPAAGAFTVTDALGRQVTFQQPPQRIVLTGKALFMIADAIYTFPEASQRLVALGSTQQGTGNFIPLIDPAFGDKAKLEGDAGAEQIAAVQPDLVILKSSMAESLGKTLEEVKIPVVYIDFETPEQYERDLATLGQLFQNEARAKEVAAFYKERVDRISQAVAGLKEEDKPRVLILYYSDKDGQVAFNVPPLTWMQTLLVQAAGGAPVWADANPGKGWTKVSLEQVAAWDPDQVYIVSYFKPVGEVIAGLKADAQWKELRALKDEKVYGFARDLYSWDQPDTRWALGLLWLAGKINPQLFPDLDIQKEAQVFYQTLYGMDEAAFQKDILPTFAGDLP